MVDGRKFFNLRFAQVQRIFASIWLQLPNGFFGSGKKFPGQPVNFIYIWLFQPDRYR